MKCKGQIKLIGNNEERRALNKVEYNEDKIIDKCIEIYNDKNPCVIHRTHATMMLCMELMREVNNNKQCNVEIKVNSNHLIWDYLDKDKLANKGVEKVIII